MREARAHILGTIRRGLKRGELSGPQRADLEARLAKPPQHLIPGRSLLPHAEQVELFIQMAAAAAAELERVDTLNEVPAAIARYLEAEGLPKRIIVAPAEELSNLPWQETEPMLEIERRKAENGDKVSVTPAFAGIAETGTLMLLSGPHSPTTLNFLPDVHIVVLEASRIVGPYEEAWRMLRERSRGMPRTVNFITGPSRSADIEQTMQLGAHGPIRLHIVLVGE